MIRLWIVFFLSFLTLACSDVGKYRQYVLPNLKLCLDIHSHALTYARAKQCALEKCEFVKRQHGVVFSDADCEKYMNELVPEVRKKR